MLFYPPIVPTPVPVPVPVVSVDVGSDVQTGSDSNTGNAESEMCRVDGVCTDEDKDSIGDADADQKDRIRINGDRLKKEDVRTGSSSSSKNDFSAEVLEGMKPLMQMDRILTSVAERFRGR